MYQIAEGNTLGLTDVDEFIGLINSPPANLRGFFDSASDIFVARAPGRLDVMGGIADYSGSLVLEMPIAEATFAAVQRCSDEAISIVSTAEKDGFELKLSELDFDDYEEVKARFSQNPSTHWASYVAGVFFVLVRELGVSFQTGCRILISSHVPVGKGVSSSAALEVAVMKAVCSSFRIDIEPVKIAMLCQTVENAVVGAPCGVMDQITANCGVTNSLLSLLCQPAEVQEIIEIPDEIEFWGIDSGVRHAVTGADYASVRVGAFMGYRIIADLAGLKTTKLENGLVDVADPRWGGYLCNISPSEYEQDLSAKIPVSISGSDFVDNFGGTTDSVTTINAAMTYPVKASTEHAIYENFRVHKFSKLLQNLPRDNSALDDLGELMFQSHASYAACGLTEGGTDRIVELARQNRINGVYGARITGGGSGGTVAVLTRRGAASTITEIAALYERETGTTPYIFHGSSPGCTTFGHLRLRAAAPAASRSS